MFSQAKNKLIEFVNKSDSRTLFYASLLMLTISAANVIVTCCMIATLDRYGFFNKDSQDLILLRKEMKELRECL